MIHKKYKKMAFICIRRSSKGFTLKVDVMFVLTRDFPLVLKFLSQI